MNNSTKIFAAANGYSGFRTYFNRVFDPLCFERLFIIKGGPGTGKSSLMRKYENAMTELGYEAVEIRCSSDPKSLDGVIVSHNGRRIGILDGTSPHATEAKYTGAVDEILDIGISFDYNELTKLRDRIIELSQKKSNAYSAAYLQLQRAGAIADKRNLSDFPFYSAADLQNAMKSYYTKHTEQKAQFIIPGNVFLISSFSKDGLVRATPDQAFGKQTKIIEDAKDARKIISSISRGALCANAICPSALSDNIPDAILTDDCFYLFSPGINSEASCEEYDQALCLAREQLAYASQYHFELEGIYTPCVNFSYHTKILDSITERSQAIFDKKPYGH